MASSVAKRAAAVGCFVLPLGVVSGAMIAVLLSVVVAYFTKAQQCAEVPSCNWYVYAGWGALLFALAAGRFAYVWMPFSPRVGTLHRRLGEDDMESLWLLVQDQTYLEEIVSCCAAEMAAEDLDERADEATPILSATPAD